MSHVFVTDPKYKWGGLFLSLFIAASWVVGFHENNFVFAYIVSIVFPLVAVIAYFKLKK